MKTYCRVCWNAVCLLLMTAGSLHGATRVAVVTTGGRDAAGNVALLVEARLAEGNNVEVLDRTEIDRVLAEQRLSLVGGVAAEQAVKAGRLLKCDLLIVIEQTPDLVKPAARGATGGNATATGTEIPARPKSATGGVQNKDGPQEKGVRSAERPDYGRPAAPSAGASAGPPVDAKPLLSLIAFDTATGLRLWDEALPSDTLDESVTTAVSGVQRAVRKQQRNVAVRDSNEKNPSPPAPLPARPGRGESTKGDPVESLKLVSLVGARNAELPRSFDSLCDSVSSLLERRLVSSSNIGLLERSHLKHLNEEQALIGEETAARILSATVLIDLQFEKAGRSIRAKALLTDSNGREVGTVSVDERELDAKTIQLLADRVLAALHAAPTRDNATTPNEAASDEALAARRSRESDRYLREARLMESFRQPDRALRAAESAALLDPRPERRAWLAKLLFNEARRELGRAYAAVRPPNSVSPIENDQERPRAPIANDLLRRALSIGGRALDLVLEFAPVCEGDGRLVLYGEPAMDQVEEPLAAYIGLITMCAPASREDALLAQSTSQQQAAVRRQLDLLAAWHAATLRDPEKLQGYASVVHNRCFPYSPNWLREVIPGERDEFERISAEQLGLWWWAAQRHDAALGIWGKILVHDLSVRSWPERASRDAIRLTLDDMARHSQPQIRWNARLALLRLDWFGVKQSTVEHLTAFQRFRRAVEAEMAAPRFRRDFDTRSAGYEVLQAGLESMTVGLPFVEQADEWLDVCHDMLDRDEVHLPLVKETLRYRLRMKDLDQRPFLIELDRAVTMTRPGSAVLVLRKSSLETTHADLERIREELLTERLELFREVASRDVEVRKLYDLTPEYSRNTGGLGAGLLCRLVVDGNRLYAAVLKNKRGNATLEAIMITLSDGALTVLGEVDLGFLNGGTESTKLLPAVCLTDDSFVVAHRTLGLFRFSRTGGGVVGRFLAQAEFPSQAVESLAYLDGRFYAGLEGGFLVEFGRDEAACRVIASSRRKEKQSGLDDRPVYAIERLATDAERHRLLFATSIPWNATGERTPPELWEYRPATGTARRLLAILQGGLLDPMGPLHNGHLLLRGGGWTIDFDAARDTAFGMTTYRVPYAEPMPLTVRTAQYPKGHAARLGDAYWSQLSTGRGSGNIHFTGAATFARLRFDPRPSDPEGPPGTAPSENSSTPRPASPPRLQEDLVRIAVDPLPPHAYASIWLLEPTGDGRLLWSDHRRLWLLTPKRPANDESPSPNDRR